MYQSNFRRDKHLSCSKLDEMTEQYSEQIELHQRSVQSILCELDRWDPETGESKRESMGRKVPVVRAYYSVLLGIPPRKQSNMGRSSSAARPVHWHIYFRPAIHIQPDRAHSQ